MMLSRRTVLLGSMMWICSSCASGASDGGVRGPGLPPPERNILLHVQNQNFYDANLYAVHGSYRQRLGFVSGLTNKTFSFRWTQLDLQVDIQFVAAGTFRTESLLVDEGDELELFIEPSLHLKGRRP